MRLAAKITSELLGPEGAAQFCWSPAGDVLAVAARRRKKVALFDRAGEVAASLTVPDPAAELLYDEDAETPVLALAWHPSGSHLAVLPRGQTFAVVWSQTGGTARVDGSVKGDEVTAMAWNPEAPELALGTAKGTGVVYNCATMAATPLALGRHAKPVYCMAWSPAAAAPGGGLLALGCRGGLLLLCRVSDGAVVNTVQLKGAVSQLQFCGMDSGEVAAPEGQQGDPLAGALLSANVGKRSVAIWRLPQALAGAPPGGSSGRSAAFELTFREAYGDLEHQCWVHPRLLVAGFSSGQVVAVSLKGTAAAGEGGGTELFSARCLQPAVAGLAWCTAGEALAAGGGCQLAVLSCRGQEVQMDGSTATTLELEAGQRIAALQYSPCGHLLTVASTGGQLLQLQARQPLLHGTWAGQLAYVDASACATSAVVLLLDVREAAVAVQQRAPVAVPLPVEPELLALGPALLAAALGTKVWVQATEPEPGTDLLPPPQQSEFPAAIRWMRLSHACLLLLGEGGCVFVQPAPGSSGGGIAELRGEDGESFSASCAGLTEHFILLGLPDGTLAFYQADGCQLISQYQHGGGGIAALFPNADGTLVMFQDTAGGAFLYNPVSDELMALPDFSGELQAAVWDGADPHVVAAVGTTGTVRVYCHIPCSVEGPGMKLVGTEAAPKGAVPLALHSGLLTWHLADSSLGTQLLATHQHLEESRAVSRSSSAKGQQLQQGSRRSSTTSGSKAEQAAAIAGAPMTREEQLAARCHQALALCHFGRALEAACQLGDPALLRELALAALQFLELPTAVAAYEAAGDEAALAQLRPLLAEEDQNLLTGHIIALTRGDADRAEQLLLSSTCSAAAIEMRRQLGHWERALELAEHLEPGALGGLAALRAEALEADGQVEAALTMYHQALEAPDLSDGSEVAGAQQRREQCQAGVARCSILLGDVEAGMELAAASGSSELLLQCAQLLEAEQLPKQAGQLYARAGRYERAAQLFLGCREFVLLDGVMQHAGSPEVWLQYAQAKEDLGSYSDAARAYEQAGNTSAAVRVLLDRLRDAEQAAVVAQRGRCAQASLAVARYCERVGKHELAVEQYCLGGDCAAACSLAKRSGCMPAFDAWARRAGSAEAALLAADCREAEGQLVAAAELCVLAGKHERAVRLFIQAGNDTLPAAIKLANESQDPAVAAVVVDHLKAVDGMGTALQDLHLALGNAEQACEVAVAYAQREQANGNYKMARDHLLKVCTELQQRGAAATPALLSSLHLLHCYLLVRTLVRQGDHLGAARLLLVVAEGIAAFPKHIVPILTSTVIECHRAALHGSAQRWAAVLMQPQHVGQVSAAYAKKIEAIAKQPAWTAEAAAAEELQCDCLFCGVPGPEASLACAACSRLLPFCAASGRRMALNDWSACPSCRFPCRGRDLTRYVSAERCCPLCEVAVAVHDVKRIFDPMSHLRSTAFAGMVAGSRKGGSGLRSA